MLRLTALVLLVLAGPCAAQAMLPADRAALDACFALAFDHRVIHLGIEDRRREAEPVAPGAGPHLARATERAPRERDSCIGIVAEPCNAAAGYVPRAMLVCLERERLVWEERRALHLAQGRGATPEALAAADRAFQAYRDALCAAAGGRASLPAMVETAQAACRLQVTARDALALEAALR